MIYFDVFDTLNNQIWTQCFILNELVKVRDAYQDEYQRQISIYTNLVNTHFESEMMAKRFCASPIT